MVPTILFIHMENLVPVLGLNMALQSATLKHLTFLAKKIKRRNRHEFSDKYVYFVCIILDILPLCLISFCKKFGLDK